ncbi:MAG: hypothetical protein B7Y47_11785 [Sphingomonas sp. 28-63-12]|nr:MAG: hypothetical protein B7Y47_11785 [Sphingomonas sp. 28-63-12]
MSLIISAQISSAPGDQRAVPAQGPIVINPRPKPSTGPIGPRFRPNREDFDNLEDYRKALEDYRSNLESWQVSAGIEGREIYKREIDIYRSEIKSYRTAVERSKR